MIYSELLTAVAAWINDPQIEPSIPTFILLAEAQMNRRLAQAGIPGATVRAACTIDAEYSELPDDFAHPTSLTLANGKAIQNITQESFQALLDRGAPAPAAPNYFTVVGGEMRFYPVPDASYGVELVYQAKVAALSPLNASNWVLAHHPDVYLYGALLQSAPFLGEDGRASTWARFYETGIDALIESERDKRGSPNTPAFRPNISSRQGYHQC